MSLELITTVWPVTREKVNAIEQLMLKEFPQWDLPVTHYFAKGNPGIGVHGVYGRALFIPKDIVLTGKIHKYEQLNVLLMGELSVLTEDGIKRVKPPFIIVSPPGTKRIAYAHEDSVWLTMHGTDETDLEKIEHTFIAQNDAEYLEHCKALQIEGVKP